MWSFVRWKNWINVSKQARRSMKLSLLCFPLPIRLFASSAYISSMNMEATGPSETLVDFY
jgi:hypothetical protein